MTLKLSDPTRRRKRLITLIVKQGRARVPARREDVPQPKGVFSSEITKRGGLRYNRIARTQSLPGDERFDHRFNNRLNKRSRA